jgi:hypothetical protein
MAESRPVALTLVTTSQWGGLGNQASTSQKARLIQPWLHVRLDDTQPRYDEQYFPWR